MSEWWAWQQGHLLLFQGVMVTDAQTRHRVCLTAHTQALLEWVGKGVMPEFSFLQRCFLTCSCSFTRNEIVIASNYSASSIHSI